MNEGQTRYFRYHMRYNKRDRLFDPSLFEHARVVLFEVPEQEAPSVFWIEDEDPETEMQEVGCMTLDRKFQLPDMAQEVSREAFESLAGASEC